MTAHIKGGAVLARLAYVVEHHGDSGLDRVLAECDPPLAKRMRSGLLRSEWFPLRGFQQVVAGIDRIFGAGDWTLAREVGRYSAKANLTSLYKVFYKVGTPSFLMGRAPTVWRAQHDHGLAKSERLSRRSFRLGLRDHPELDLALAYSIVGWSLGAIELSGGHLARHEEVEVAMDGDDRRYTWIVRWV